MTGPQVSQILWVGKHPNAASLPGLAAAKLAIIALDQVQAALAYLAAGHPVDGLLLDLTASATEGLDALRALQAQAPDLPVIVWVSPAQTSLGLEAVGAGAQDYLIKGQTPIAELWRAVGCALERHRVLVSLLDISERVQLEAERKQAEALLTTRIRQQEAVTQLGLAATGAKQLGPILQQAVEQVAAVLDVEFCTILELTAAGSQLQLVAGVGWHPDRMDTVTVRLDQASQARLTLRSPDPIYIDDMGQETRFSATPLLNDYGIVSGMSVAIRVQGEPWGVLGAHSRHPRRFSTDDTYFVQSVAALLALVIERVATQAALGESYQQMQTAQRIAALGSWDYDIVSDRLRWSKACHQAAGLAPDQAMLTCDDFLQHVHPDDLDMVKQRFEQASRDGQRPAPQGHRTPLDYEHRWICPSGEVRHLHQRGEITYDSSGTPLHMVGTLQNVTAQAEAEAERRQAEARLHRQATLLTNAERIGQMGSWSMDIPNNRLVWSRGTYRLFGLPPDHRIENFEQFLERVLPEDRPKLLAAQRQAEESTGLVSAEYRIRRPNGEIRWLAERGNVEFDAEGRPLRRLGMVMDVTAQKAAEATLRASEERFRLVSRATSDAIWDRDILAQTTWRGEGFKTLFGYSDADLQAPNNWWHGLLHPDDRLRVLASIQTALEGNASSWKDEYRFRCQDGSYAYVMNRGYIIRNAQGQAMRMIGGMLNLTEQKNLEAQLLQSQKMEAIGQLTGGMAHDFNNLLTVIMGNAELLVEQLDAHPQLRSLADMIALAAQRGVDLTQRLLGFARSQTLDPQPVDVNQLIAHMQGLLRRTLGEQIEVRCSCDHHLWPALVDAPQLESALLNLCINARDAMGRVGCLTLTTAQVPMAPEGGDRPVDLPPGDYVMVAVSDTGVGMTADLLSRAVEPFFTTKAKGKGTGLGLSMVYGFVRQSNGGVKIDSEPGMGTTVRLYLPCCGDHQRLTLEGPALESDQPPQAVIYGGDAELILLVEDNTLVRDYAQRQLESLNYRVLVAENGPAALAMLRQQPEIDLLFTDVIMPGGLNGRELAAAARQLWPQLRVLYTSGYTENALTDQQGPEAEIQLLPKPYQRAELAHKIRQALTGG